MNSAIKILNEKIDVIAKGFPYINQGGCGHFAILLGTELEKRGYKPEYIIYTDSNKKVIEEAKDVLAKNPKVELSYLFFTIDFNHVHIMIDLDGYLIDGVNVYNTIKETTYNEDKGYREGLSVDLKTLKRWVTEKRCWNYVFEKKHSVEALKFTIIEITKNIEDITKEMEEQAKAIQTINAKYENKC